MALKDGEAACSFAMCYKYLNFPYQVRSARMNQTSSKHNLSLWFQVLDLKHYPWSLNHLKVCNILSFSAASSQFVWHSYTLLSIWQFHDKVFEMSSAQGEIYYLYFVKFIFEVFFLFSTHLVFVFPCDLYFFS